MTDIFIANVFGQDLIAALVITCVLALALVVIKAWS